MTMLDNNAADILSLDAGEVFVGGRYNSLIPLMQHLFEGNVFINIFLVMHLLQILLCTFIFKCLFYSDGSTEYYAVALIKKNTLKDVYNLGHLNGKKACFAGVGTQAGWNIPINTVRFNTTWILF